MFCFIVFAYLLCSLLPFSSSLLSLLLISSSFFLSSLVHLPSPLFLLLCGPPLDAHSLVEHLHLLAGVGYHHNLCLLLLGLLHFAHLPPHLPQGHTGHRHQIGQYKLMLVMCVCVCVYLWSVLIVSSFSKLTRLSAPLPPPPPHAHALSLQRTALTPDT